MVFKNSNLPYRFGLFCLMALVCLITIGLTNSQLASASEKGQKKLNNGSQTKNDKTQTLAVASNVIYVEDNDPRGNSILAYRRNADGSIQSTPFGTFPTGGKGTGNPLQLVGPPDNDTPLIASSDGKFLLACNYDSNDISVFSIKPDGGLSAVPGSPFPSGGKNPVSLSYFSNKKLGRLVYVANKAQSPIKPVDGPHPSGDVPNYTGFKMSDTGVLTIIPNSTIKVATGGSPSQVLIVAGKYVFAQDLYGIPSNTKVPAPLAPFLPQRISLIHSFKINKADGRIIESSKSPNTAPNADAPLPFLLGMIAHPIQSIIYQGLVSRNELGVYTYDSKGNTTFVRSIPSRGSGLCWMSISKDGKKLYTSNTFDGTVSFFDLSDPLNPIEKQVLFLANPGPPSPSLFPPFASQPYQLSLDSTEKFLYVVNERSTSDVTITEGNSIHFIQLAADGSMTETFAPVATPISKETGTLGIAIQGIVVF